MMKGARMMKYIVKLPFRDKENNLITRQKGDVIDITKKRAKAITDVLGLEALEPLKEVDKDE